MAKQKNSEPSDIEPANLGEDQTPEGSAEQTAEADRIAEEVLALEARKAALEQEVYKLQAIAEAKAPEPESYDGPVQKYVVRLKDNPPWVVAVPHPALAFEAYKQAVGIINTPHAPQVTKAPDGAELGRFQGD